MKNSSYRSKNKPCGMKDGGRVHANPNMLGIGMARDAGATLAGRQRQIDTAIEQATNPVVTSQPNTVGGLSSRRDGATPPADMLARRGMKDGGTVKYKQDGGKINGPGGPTDDKAGTFALSPGEYVLPADTTAAIGIGKLDALRNATHEFVDESKRGMANGGTEEEKRRMVKAGGSEIVQGMRPETRNNVELAKLQKPVMQSVGEGIGEMGGAAARGIGTAARKLEDTRKATLSVANNLPGAVAAPIATAASGFGAAVRTGYTGQPQTGTEYVGKPLFGDAVPSAVAAPVTPTVKPSMVAPVTQPIKPAVVPPNQVQAAPVNAASSVAPTNNYGIGKFSATSNRADGKQNVFAGGAGGYSVNPADFAAATARAAQDKANLTSMAVSNIDGTAEGLDKAYRLAAGDPQATAAVEAAINQRKLGSAAIGGNKNATAILNQQNESDTRIGVANIGAKTAQATNSLQQKQFESNDAVNQIDIKTKQAKLKDVEQATALRDQILVMSDDDPKKAGLVSKYNLLTGVDSKDKFTPLMGKDELGNPVYIGAFDNRTGNMKGAAGQGAVTPRAEYDKLPSGAVYTGPDGKQYKKG